jgi:hypothetical protein
MQSRSGSAGARYLHATVEGMVRVPTGVGCHQGVVDASGYSSGYIEYHLVPLPFGDRQLVALPRGHQEKLTVVPINSEGTTVAAGKPQ